MKALLTVTRGKVNLISSQPLLKITYIKAHHDELTTA